MIKKQITRIDNNGNEFTAFIMWDNYLTIDAKTAKKLSVTGKLPKPGFEVKSNYTFPSIGMFEARIAWIARTQYDGKECFYIN